MTDPPTTAAGIDIERSRPFLDAALAMAADRTLDIESRAGVYAVLQQIQLRIRRVLGIGQRGDTLQNELIAHIEANGLKQLGPLYVASSRIDPAWPCNDPDNWDDLGVQGSLRVLAADPETAEYVRHIPDHYEIDAAALGAAIMAGHGTATSLLLELKARGWTTDEGRRLALKVRAPKVTP